MHRHSLAAVLLRALEAPSLRPDGSLVDSPNIPRSRRRVLLLQPPSPPGLSLRASSVRHGVWQKPWLPGAPMQPLRAPHSSQESADHAPGRSPRSGKTPAVRADLRDLPHTRPGAGSSARVHTGDAARACSAKTLAPTASIKTERLPKGADAEFPFPSALLSLD